MAIIARSQFEVSNMITRQISANGLAIISDPTLLGMVDVFSSRLSELYTNQETVISGFRLANAAGTRLDVLSVERGVTRFRTNTIGDLSTTNFKFYLAAGKTGKDFALIQDQPLVIPSGQKIVGGEWIFYTTTAATIQPDANSGYVGIQASIRVGTDVSVGLLKTHEVFLPSVTNIDMTKSPTLFCSNDRAIVVTPQNESDESLRLRVQNRVNSMNNTNEDAIRLVLKDIGITNVGFRKDMFGVGMLGIELLTGGAILTDEIMNAADGVIKRVAPFARVIRPEYLGVQFCLSLVLYNYDQRDTTLSEILTNLFTYFDSMQMGTMLSKTTLERNVTLVSNVKSAKLITMKIDGRRVTLADQVAAPTERFILMENAVEFSL